MENEEYVSNLHDACMPEGELDHKRANKEISKTTIGCISIGRK